MDFKQTQQAYIHLKDQLEQGRATAEEFEARVNEMVVTDSAGVLWQIGVKTGKWYRYDGQGWVEDTPREFGGIDADFTPLVTPQNVQPYQNQTQPPKITWVSILIIVGVFGACCVVIVIGGLFVWGNTPLPAPTSVVPSSSSATTVTPLSLTLESGNTTALPGFPPDLVQFQDDFSNPESGWDDIRVRDDFNTYYFDDAYLFVILKAATSAESNLHLNFPSDVQVEVDARKTSGSQNDEYGLLCRYVENSDGTSSYYYFAITIYGAGLVYKVDHDEALTINSPQMEMSGIVLPGNQVNRMRADCVGDTLTLYVNGQFLNSTTDSSLNGGNVGLRVDSETGETEIRFDNFIVFKPGYQE